MMSRRSVLIFSFIAFASITFHGCSSAEWNYADLGMDVWADHFPNCGGSEQSPIDIQVRKTKYKKFAPFRLSAEYFKTKEFQLTNDGRSISATLVDTQQPFLSVAGGGLKGTYKFVNFHLHWGQNYASGSEHRVDGKKYAADLHIVHEQTVTKSLAVLGFLVKSVRDEDNADDSVSNAWRTFFTAGSGLTKVNQTTTVHLNLGSLIQNNLEKFWRYEGSLTVPPCTEGLPWTVFSNPIDIFDKNIDKFRRNVAPLTFRDPQPLKGRQVYRSYHRYKSSRSRYY